MIARKMTLLEVASNKEDLICRIAEIIKNISNERNFPVSEVLQDLDSVMRWEDNKIKECLSDTFANQKETVEVER